MPDAADRPVLLLDVDGVLVVYLPVLNDAGATYLEDGEVWGYETQLNLEAAPLIAELAERFDLAWNTRWGESANRALSPALGIGQLPVLDLGDRECRFTKVPAVRAFAGTRAVAWIDDELGDDAEAWAAARPHPTLLVRTNAVGGITRAATDRLLAFAASLAG